MKDIGRKQNVVSPKRKRGIAEPPALAPRVQKMCVYVLKGLLLAWLFASILFAHGCHGNEDHELFGEWIEWIWWPP